MDTKYCIECIYRFQNMIKFAEKVDQKFEEKVNDRMAACFKNKFIVKNIDEQKN